MPLFVGDEVDYSAPYITVEGGELVTKYPTREHEAEPLTWLVPLFAVAVIAMWLYLRGRRRKKAARAE